MTDYEEQLSALVEEISTAFQGVSRAGGVSLSESWVIDDYGSDEERATARAEDTDTQWQDVPEEGIYYGYSCLSFLDEIGLRYYMPAYMIWSLKHYQTTDSNTPESTISSLVLSDYHEWERHRDFKLQHGFGGVPDYQDIQDWQLQRFLIFTSDQSKAIAHFLHFMAQHNEDDSAQKALDRYWHKFVQQPPNKAM